MNTPKLFIPGPTEVLPEVLAEMSHPMVTHRNKTASELQRRISNNLRRVLLTKNEILLSTSSGTGFMEGAVRSTTAKRAAIFSVGAFGKKWYKIAQGNGVPSDIFESELGQPTTPEMVDAALATGKYDTICVTHNETSTGIQNPVEEIAELLKSKYPEVVWCVDAVSSAAGSKIETDKLGIDCLVTSTQKALALPPGMAVCAISQKAYERTATVKNRGCYFDLRDIYDVIQKKDYQYTNTPCVSIMFAMDKQLQHILQEGVEHRFERHEKMAEYVRNWAREYFAIFPNEKYLSKTLTVVTNTRNLNIGDLNKALIERGMLIGNGYGDLKDKTFRIAHMGELTLDDCRAVTESILDICGIK
ncbi:MAG: alanine--glyoxylate aminotransferase family protein [Opitutales bacterium]|nr:alanine--glyoxylate aminotransferase family protein [Opitutales bacterium]